MDQTLRVYIGVFCKGHRLIYRDESYLPRHTPEQELIIMANKDDYVLEKVSHRLRGFGQLMSQNVKRFAKDNTLVVMSENERNITDTMKFKDITQDSHVYLSVFSVDVINNGWSGIVHGRTTFIFKP